MVSVLALITHAIDVKDEGSFETWEISMPGVKVPSSDTYLCTAIEIPDAGNDESYYINAFNPHNSGNAHHLAVYLCNDTGIKDPFAQCDLLIYCRIFIC